jgi:hypothetical protein
MFTLSKIKLMKDTIEELFDTNNLEICERTNFNHEDEKGIEYVCIKFHVMPSHNSIDSEWHFEYTIAEEVFDPDSAIYTIRFYSTNENEGMIDDFKSIYRPNKYNDDDLENQLFKLYTKLSDKYFETDDELSKLASIMENIKKANKGE